MSDIDDSFERLVEREFPEQLMAEQTELWQIESAANSLLDLAPNRYVSFVELRTGYGPVFSFEQEQVVDAEGTKSITSITIFDDEDEEYRIFCCIFVDGTLDSYRLRQTLASSVMKACNTVVDQNCNDSVMDIMTFCLAVVNIDQDKTQPNTSAVLIFDRVQQSAENVGAILSDYVSSNTPFVSQSKYFTKAVEGEYELRIESSSFLDKRPHIQTDSKPLTASPAIVVEYVDCSTNLAYEYTLSPDGKSDVFVSAHTQDREAEELDEYWDFDEDAEESDLDEDLEDELAEEDIKTMPSSPTVNNVAFLLSKLRQLL
jgi:hypothetical protein